MKHTLLLFLMVLIGWVGRAELGQAQDRSRTFSKLALQMTTPGSAYEYESEKMTGIFNKNLNRFEFEAPLVSFLSLNPPALGELLFPNGVVPPEAMLLINLALPDRALDLGNFRGNQRLQLRGEVRLGDIVFNMPVEVEGLFRNNSEMILSFDIPIAGEVQALRALHLQEMHLIAQDVRLYFVTAD